MAIPAYLNNSFTYDDDARLAIDYGRRRSITPYLCWRQLLNLSMANLKYEYITKLCLYSKGSQAHFKRGLLLDILGIDDLAALEYGEAIKLNPDMSLYYNNRGNLYMLRDRPRLAISDFNRAVDLDPTRAEAYYNRGRAFDAIGDTEAAKKDYRKAVELGICSKFPNLKICK